MASMAVVCLTGRPGDDSKLNHMPDGTAVLKFSLAVTTGYNKSERTTWWNCDLWGKQAEKLQQYLLKGKLIGVTGEPSLREYSTDSGKRQSLEVRVNNVILLGSKPQGEAVGDDDGPVPF